MFALHRENWYHTRKTQPALIIEHMPTLMGSECSGSISDILKLLRNTILCITQSSLVTINPSHLHWQPSIGATQYCWCFYPSDSVPWSPGKPNATYCTITDYCPQVLHEKSEAQGMSRSQMQLDCDRSYCQRPYWMRRFSRKPVQAENEDCIHQNTRFFLRLVPCWMKLT